MISAAALTPKPAPRLRRAMEPTDPFSRAALVGVRWRHGNPYQDRRAIRVSQRLAAGMSVAEVARAERTDTKAIESLLARDGFAAVIESYRAMAEQPEAEQTARLVRLARIAIENALSDWDMGAAFFVLREDAQGRDPAHTIAKRIIATAKRTADSVAPMLPAETRTPSPATPPTPPRAYDPLDALVHRQTAALRRAVVAEQAVRAEAANVVANDGAAATMVAARKALALKADAGRCPVSPVASLTRRLAFGTAMPIVRGLDADPHAKPLASHPRRPRAP
jgi:hypothetical protein